MAVSRTEANEKPLEWGAKTGESPMATTLHNLCTDGERVDLSSRSLFDNFDPTKQHQKDATEVEQVKCSETSAEHIDNNSCWAR